MGSDYQLENSFKQSLLLTYDMIISTFLLLLLGRSCQRFALQLNYGHFQLSVMELQVVISRTTISQQKTQDMKSLSLSKVLSNTLQSVDLLLRRGDHSSHLGHLEFSFQKDEWIPCSCWEKHMQEKHCWLSNWNQPKSRLDSYNQQTIHDFHYCGLKLRVWWHDMSHNIYT